MQITVLSAVKTPSVSKAGKPYTYLELAYKDQEGKVTGKKVMPFGEGKNVFEALAGSNNGDVFHITSVKNEVSGYWDWTKANRDTGVPGATTPFIATNSTSTPVSKPTSTYETSEERAKKQVYIVRQSSISAAIAFGKAKSTKEVIDTAKEFETFVFSTGEPEKPVALPKVPDIFEDDDIPL